MVSYNNQCSTLKFRIMYKVLINLAQIISPIYINTHPLFLAFNTKIQNKYEQWFLFCMTRVLNNWKSVIFNTFQTYFINNLFDMQLGLLVRVINPYTYSKLKWITNCILKNRNFNDSTRILYFITVKNSFSVIIYFNTF